MQLRPYQESFVDQIRTLWMDLDSIVLQSATGCHAAGQGLLDYYGKHLKVEDVKVGDLLMGPDSEPRAVLGLFRGHAQMYDIIPTKGAPFRVNGDHLLSLVRTQDGSKAANKIIDISVADYLKQSRSFKHVHKLFRVPVTFPASCERQLAISPWMLGALLGDGSMINGIGLTGEDREVIDPVCEEYAQFGLQMRLVDRGDTRSRYHGTSRRWSGHHDQNAIMNALKPLGLKGVPCGEKFIPERYLLASRNNRLELLAGLIDTDGAYCRGGFDFISKSRRLSEDVAFLCRSLGLAAYVAECQKSSQTGFTGTYWRVSISGDCSVVPCKVPRKQAKPRSQIKDVLRTGLNVVPAGEEDYFGFMLSGDGRYLMDDFTVTHNSGKGTVITYIVKNAALKGNRSLFAVHGRHLVFDMDERLDHLGLDHGVIMASHPRRKPWLPSQVASIDTLARRLDRLPDAQIVIVDECRLATSPTWRSVIEAYKQKGAKILGMDATPMGPNGRGLGEGGLFQAMILGPQPQELIDQGYLVPSDVYWPEGGAEARAVRNVKRIGGELDAAAQAAIVDKPKLIGDLVKEWELRGRNDKTIVFGVHQKHAKDIAEQFRCAGHDFAYVDSDTPEEERKRIWRDFDHGTCNGIVNVRVLGYGWDHPITSCIVDAAATGSLPNHLQKWGRGTRPSPGKKRFIIIDHYGNVGEHGMYEECRSWDLAGVPKKERTKDDAPRVARCTTCFRTFRLGKTACPYCGAPLEKKYTKIHTADGTLGKYEKKLLSPEEWQRKLAREDERRSKFLEFCEIAHRKGYKKGWPAMQFKLIFHTWPVKAWIEEAEARGLRPVADGVQVGLGI